MRIGGVGEGRGALVGGDDEIGIVARRGARRPCGGTTSSPVDVVGDRQQAGDEVDVGLACRPRRSASRLPPAGEPLREEAALGADRHDDGVLDLLRLDQAEHLGAVVLRAIRPAQAAARHRAEAQMHAFDLGAVDEDLAPRARLGQAVDQARVELDRQRLALVARSARDEMVGAQRRLDQVEVAADDRVVVDVRNVLQRVLDLRLEVLGRDLAFLACSRVEPGDEQACKPRAMSG